MILSGEENIDGGETKRSATLEPLAYIVSADMGYGHRRAVYPLRHYATPEIIIAGNNDKSTTAEKILWERILRLYENFSKARGVPIVGKYIFNILDTFLRIPSLYPMRNLSEPTFQVNLLDWVIKKGLCTGLLSMTEERHLPLVTSFYAPAVAADRAGYDSIYCIICDADLNRVWVAKEPYESRINYFVPCGKAGQRLRQYGVDEHRIFVTGFPLDESLLGDDLSILKRDVGQRLHYLDPSGRFEKLHRKSVEHFLGKEAYTFHNDRVLTLTYAVGGAGAQRENARRIVRSLRKKLRNGELGLNLVAGVKKDVADFFSDIVKEFAPDAPHINIVYRESVDDYFDAFNDLMHTTDILWTKPSELSFFAGLGIPIIMSPTIGSQEKFNRKWLREIKAGIKQENPDYTDQWLFDFLHDGHIADAAWSGFLKARKLGTRHIRDVLLTGDFKRDDSPLCR